MITAFAGFALAFGACVPTHKQSRDWTAKRTAQSLNGSETGFVAHQRVIRNNQVRQEIVVRESPQCCFLGCGGHNLASPLSQQSTHAIANHRIVVNHDDQRALILSVTSWSMGERTAGMLCAAAKGTTTEKRDPRPSCERNSIE